MPAYNDCEQPGQEAPAHHPSGGRARRALAPAVQGRRQGLASRRHAVRGAGLHLPGPDRRPRPQDAPRLPRKGQGHGRPDPAPRPDQQGPRLRAGHEGPGQVPRASPVPERRDGHHPAQDLLGPGVHERRQRIALSRRCKRDKSHLCDHRRDVRGEQAPEDPPGRSPTSSSTSASARATPSPSPRAWPRPAPRPVVDIYSTFLQRSYDQIFQEVALQNLPVVFMPRPRRPRRRRRPDPPRQRTTWPTCGCSPTWW